MELKNDALYMKSHEWVVIDGDTATVGISDFAQSELGDLVFVNLPEPGDEVTAGETFADVESVKAVSDIYSPVSGVIAEINEELLDAPELINENANDAWFIKVENVTEQADDLMAPEEYEAFCEMCSILGVSKQALSIRMKNLGLLGEDQLSNPFGIMDIFMEEEEIV